METSDQHYAFSFGHLANDEAIAGASVFSSRITDLSGEHFWNVLTTYPF